jgi:phosphotriesterase-related protein
MRAFICLMALVFLVLPGARSQHTGMIMTVKGPIPPAAMGLSLIHEHILVDFIGADKIHPGRWQHGQVMAVALPYLQQWQGLGGQTLVECTPAYLGRDPRLLQKLADTTGLHILTNTGYYGASNNKYLPAHAYTETADQLARRWIAEWQQGIAGTGIRPGFIKIGVNEGPLSELHRKLVTAAARTHLATGLTIASHTGKALAAREQLALLEKEGVAPQAFIWVHAQAEKDYLRHVAAAQKGAWISLDGVSEANLEEYLRLLQHLKSRQLLHRVLLSQDAGWYRPGEPRGGDYRGYTALVSQLVPRLKQAQFTEAEIHQLLVVNPAKAFAIQVHRRP